MLTARAYRRSVQRVANVGGPIVTLSEARAVIVDPPTDDNALIERFVEAATDAAERETGRAWRLRAYRLTLDGFPVAALGLDYLPAGVTQIPVSFALGDFAAIELPFEPIASVDSVTVYSRADATSIVSPSVWRVDLAHGRLSLREGQVWPVDLRPSAAVEIDYQAGYAVGEDVPAEVTQAIIEHTAAMYERRGGCAMPGECKRRLAAYSGGGLWK